MAKAAVGTSSFTTSLESMACKTAGRLFTCAHVRTPVTDDRRYVKRACRLRGKSCLAVGKGPQ